ncbi:MAG TPA: polyketide synthase dehydratase domain-containing protein, partial [Ruminiclostridium sp.]|nr:polyketide synthase dehydratase domain-containing protein [Ruminiclostridium sp.]
MAIHASKEYYGCDVVELRDVRMLQPIVVEDTPVRVQTVLRTEGGTNQFKLISCVDDSNSVRNEDWKVHAKGEIVLGERPKPPLFGKIQDMLEACGSEIVDCDRLINRYNFIHFGQRWQTLKSMRMGKHNAIGYFELPPELEDEVESFTIHPALLDAATGIIASKRKNTGDFYLPVSYGRIKVYRSVPAKLYSYYSLPHASINNETLKGNITLLDKNGYTVLEVEDYILKRVNNLSQTIQGMSGKRNLYYQIKWKPQDLNSENGIGRGDCVAIFTDTQGLVGDKIAKELRKSQAEVIEISFRQCFEKTGQFSYSIGGAEDDYDKLIEVLKYKPLKQIVHLSSIAEEYEVETLDDLQAEKERGVYSLYCLTRALVRNKIRDDIDMILVSDYANKVTGDDVVIKPQNASFLSLGKVLDKEHSNLKFRCIDIDNTVIVENILEEIESTGQSYYAAYRDGVRYTEEFSEMNIENVPVNEIGIREGGVYLITGGIGGLGLELAEYLADRSSVTLVLVNRTKLPPVEGWDEILKKQHESKLCGKITKIRAIE